MSSDYAFSKEEIDYYLKKLSAEYKRRNKNKTPVEIIIVGGAAAMLNYSFRESTLDVDAYYTASSALKDAIRAVAEKESLEPDWLNNDFQFLSQCNPEELRLHSRYYKRYANGLLEIRTVAAEYLIALKTRSGRRFRNDLSDIVGVLEAEKDIGNIITMEHIDRAITELFSGKDKIPKDVYEEVRGYVSQERNIHLYDRLRELETDNFRALKEYSDENTIKGKLEAGEILKELNKRRNKQ